MKNFILDECQIERALKNRFKVSPVRIEPWIDNVNINANAVSSQNLTYTWRFGKDIQDSGPVSGSRDFPFYVGVVKINAYNSDPLQDSIANAYSIIQKQDIYKIENFYNTVGVQCRRFGVGTFEGTGFPNPGTNVNSNQMGNPWSVLGPFMQVQSFADATGAVYLDVNMSFQGYQVWLQ